MHRSWIVWVLIGVGALVFLFLVPMQCRIVGAGERGVVLTWGKVEDRIWDEGLHFKRPISQQVKKVNVKVLKAEVEIGAASKDLQEVSAVIALNYHLDPLQVNRLYQRVGRQYEQVIVQPAIQEVTKATTAKFTAEELITRRQDVKEDIKEALTARISTFNIVVDEFAIVNFNFSDQFNSAIEAKQTAAQNAIKASRDLDRIRVEAEQKVVQAEASKKAQILEAEAQARSLELQRSVLTKDLIQLRAIEKWNGQMPTYTGGPLPFLDLLGK